MFHNVLKKKKALANIINLTYENYESIKVSNEKL